MGDKVTNALIVIILIVIIGLIGIYIYKVEGGNFDLLNFISKNETNEDIVTSTPIINNTNSGSKPQTSQGQNVDVPKIGNGEYNTSQGTTITSNGNSVYKYNNKYYYNQLDDYSKIIYNAIIDNIKTSEYGRKTIKIDYDFANLLMKSGGQEKLKLYYDDAINAINLDIPNLFYVEFSKMFLRIETTTSMFGTKYELYIDTGDNGNFISDEFTSVEQVEGNEKLIEGIKGEICALANGDDYNKLRVSHDWLIEKLVYDGKAKNKGDIYGAFIDKKAVCEGYARAYKYILDSLGVENILATGIATNSKGATEDHMWNYVKLNNKWYAVDVTWDDPIITGGGTISGETKHKYFLIGSNQLSKTHKEKNTISNSEKEFKLPTLSTEKYK